MDFDNLPATDSGVVSPTLCHPGGGVFAETPRQPGTAICRVQLWLIPSIVTCKSHSRRPSRRKFPQSNNLQIA